MFGHHPSLTNKDDLIEIAKQYLSFCIKEEEKEEISVDPSIAAREFLNFSFSLPGVGRINGSTGPSGSIRTGLSEEQVNALSRAAISALNHDHYDINVARALWRASNFQQQKNNKTSSDRQLALVLAIAGRKICMNLDDSLQVKKTFSFCEHYLAKAIFFSQQNGELEFSTDKRLSMLENAVTIRREINSYLTQENDEDFDEFCLKNFERTYGYALKDIDPKKALVFFKGLYNNHHSTNDIFGMLQDGSQIVELLCLTKADADKIVFFAKNLVSLTEVGEGHCHNGVPAFNAKIAYAKALQYRNPSDEELTVFSEKCLSENPPKNVQKDFFEKVILNKATNAMKI